MLKMLGEYVHRLPRRGPRGRKNSGRPASVASRCQADRSRGQRPNDTPVAVMPFESLAQMSDAELDALLGFLKSLPAKDSGTR